MAKPVRRLSNIRPREVSLVDEAANNRRFIVVKSKNGGPNMAGKSNSDLLNDDEGNVLKLSAEVKETLKNQGKGAIEKIQSVLKKVEEFEVSKDANDEIPESLAKEFDEVMKSLPQITNEDGGNSEGSSNDSGEVDSIEKLASEFQECKKAGKKISSGRLKKITDAVSILQGLIDELNTGASSNTNKGKDGADNNTKGGNSTMEKNRSPEDALKMADADLIKAKENVTVAEAKGEDEGIKKAKEEFSTADETQKKAKEVVDKNSTDGEVKKAEDDLKVAQETLRKAKGEPENPDDKNTEMFKSIIDGQKQINERLDKSAEENKTLADKVEGISKTAKPSNSNDSNDDNNSGKDENVDKKYDKGFWAGVI